MADSDRQPASIQVAGIQRYQQSLVGMLRRLADERLVERLWSRDPSLWYPAAETQARIRSRLGWLDLPVRDSREIQDWLSALQSHQIGDVLYVGPGDPGIIARLWRDLAPEPHCSQITVLDSIESRLVSETLAAIAWDRTAIVLAGESALAPDAEALARLVLAARSQSASSYTPPLTVIAPPDSMLLPLVQSYTEPMLLLPSDLGARFGPLSALGLIPAALLGWEIERLRVAALAMCVQCERGDDLTLNPGVWLGTTLAVLAQHGHDKLTLLASPELLPLARWIAAFVSGSLSKHGRGFVTSVEEPRHGRPPGMATRNQGARQQGSKAARQQTNQGVREQTNQGAREQGSKGQDQIIVGLRLAGAEHAALDRRCAVLGAAGAPVVTLDLEDRYAVAGQMLMWQVAVAAIGVVLGLNPFDEPDTDARHAYLWRRLQSHALPALPPATPLEPESLRVAWQQLSPAIETTRCIAVVAYLPPTSAVSDGLADLRALLSRRFDVVTVVIDPLREQSFATQVLHAGRPTALLLLTADAAQTVAVPGLDWTLEDLRHERIAADALAWNRLARRFVHLDLGADPVHGLRRCLDLLARLDP